MRRCAFVKFISHVYISVNVLDCLIARSFTGTFNQIKELTPLQND